VALSRQSATSPAYVGTERTPCHARLVAFRCGGWELLTSDDSKLLLPYEVQSRLARIHEEAPKRKLSKHCRSEAFGATLHVGDVLGGAVYVPLRIAATGSGCVLDVARVGPWLVGHAA
jgi:hypothetical protein